MSKNGYEIFSYVIMSIVLCLIMWMIGLILGWWSIIDENTLIEKTKMCSDYYFDFKLKVDSEKFKGDYIKVGGIELFYSKKLNTCVGSYWVQYGDGLGNYNTSYFVIDYLHGDKQLFYCESFYTTGDLATLNNDFDCMDKFRNKRDKYKDFIVND